MASTMKYKSSRVFWDSLNQKALGHTELETYRKGKHFKLPNHVHRFDSQHEFLVYLELVRLYGEDRVVCQHRIEIFPVSYCYPKGKDWKVDFAIKNKCRPYEMSVYFEAKGMFLPSFGFTLAAFEQLDPDEFEKLHIVFSRSIPLGNRIVTSLLDSEMGDNLMTLKQLKKWRIPA